MSTILDELIVANYNLNKNKTGNLHIDNMTDSFGKELLREVIKQIENGAKLDDEYMGCDLMPTIKHTRESIAELEKEREQFKQQRNELIEDIQAQRDLLKEFSKFIDYKLYIHPGNCTYLSYRNELDQLGICKENE